jgi:hypothetical protein
MHSGNGMHAVVLVAYHVTAVSYGHKLFVKLPTSVVKESFNTKNAKNPSIFAKQLSRLDLACFVAQAVDSKTNCSSDRFLIQLQTLLWTFGT